MASRWSGAESRKRPFLSPRSSELAPTKGDMEALGSFTARAVDALAKEGYCVIQLPLSLAPRGPSHSCKSHRTV